jgi:heat shock protein HslJ
MLHSAIPRRPRAARAWCLTAALAAGTSLTEACARSPRAAPSVPGSATGAVTPSTSAGVAGAGDTQGDSLTGRRWTLVELNGRPVTTGVGGDVPYIRLRADTARVEGFTGCNSIFGRYERGAGGRLRFEQLGGTLRACADSAPADQERRFMAALTATRRYAIRADTLTLSDDAALRARLAATGR